MFIIKCYCVKLHILQWLPVMILTRFSRRYPNIFNGFSVPLLSKWHLWHAECCFWLTEGPAKLLSAFIAPSQPVFMPRQRLHRWWRREMVDRVHDRKATLLLRTERADLWGHRALPSCVIKIFPVTAAEAEQSWLCCQQKHWDDNVTRKVQACVASVTFSCEI